MSFMRRFFRVVLFLSLPPWKSPPKLPVTPEERIGEDEIPEELLANSALHPIVESFGKQLAASSSQLDVLKAVRTHAGQLWRHSKKTVQAGVANKKEGDAAVDDRPLYWARLRMASMIRSHVPSGYALSRAERLALIEMLEQRSRGISGAVFPKILAKGTRRVLISGFDPFGFPAGGDLRQGNPSGAAVLALDGRTIRAGSVKGRVEGVVFPVRFADFDRGIVERAFSRHLRGKRPADMIMTISQGGLEHHRKGRDKKHPNRRKRFVDAFELEKWAGQRRGSDYPDNLGVRKPGQPRRRGERLDGPEFIKSTLRREQIIEQLRGRKGKPGKETADESEFRFRPSLPGGGFGAPEWGGRGRRDEPLNPPTDARSVEGSGGDYLSNEVFYRTALLAKENEKGTKSAIPVGHLHVPYSAPPTTPEAERAHFALLEKIIRVVTQIIRLALPNLGTK